MIDIVNIIQFPETPEEMHRLLQIEAQAKQDGGLTTNGLAGYIVYMWRAQRLAYRLQHDAITYGFSAIDMTTGERVDPRSIEAVWD